MAKRLIALDTVLVDSAVLEDARAAGVNLRKACEAGLIERTEEARKWRDDNKDALEESNKYVEEHGMPLAQYRPF